MNNYQFNDGIIRGPATVEFSGRRELGEQDLEFRGGCSVYLRKIDSELQNLFNENNTRWGNAETYDHTRTFPQKGTYGDKGNRHGAGGAFLGDCRYNQRMVNCDVGGEMESYNENYCDGDWGNSVYLGGHPLSQVKYAANASNYAPIELEFGDIDCRNNAREVGNYSVNRGGADDYRDSERTEDCDAFKAFATTNLQQRYKGKKRTGDKTG